MNDKEQYINEVGIANYSLECILSRVWPDVWRVWGTLPLEVREHITETYAANYPHSQISRDIENFSADHEEEVRRGLDEEGINVYVADTLGGEAIGRLLAEAFKEPASNLEPQPSAGDYVVLDCLYDPSMVGVHVEGEEGLWGEFKDEAAALEAIYDDMVHKDEFTPQTWRSDLREGGYRLLNPRLPF